MVMPCSRSSLRPSVRRLRSTWLKPLRRLVRSMASHWSIKTLLASYSRRPMRVDLPSSTEPAVVKRRRSAGTPVGADVGEGVGEVTREGVGVLIG